MPKDRDQLTPDDPEDAGRIRPLRSADREAENPVDPSTGPGPATHGSDPPAVDEVDSAERANYE